MLSRQHRRPAGVVIFGTDDATAVSCLERLGTCSDAYPREQLRDEHVGRAETIIDPAVPRYFVAHPRKVNRVAEVSFAAKRAAVARSLCEPQSTCRLASAESGLTSSPIQLLMADGVTESLTCQSAPSCSRLTGGHISPARAENAM